MEVDITICEGDDPGLETPEYEIIPGKYKHTYYTCEAATDGGEDKEYRNVDVYTVDYQVSGTPAWALVTGSETSYEFEIEAVVSGSNRLLI